MKSVTKLCEFCGKPISVRLTDVKRGYGKYCSLSCSSKANGAKVRQQKQMNLFTVLLANKNIPKVDYYSAPGNVKILPKELKVYQKFIRRITTKEALFTGN